MKFLIVGLGNPGAEYEKNRHNIGYRIVEELCKKYKGEFLPNKTASVCNISFKGKKLVLIKPTTFMNLSGKSVNYWMQKENIPLERILVLTDDLSLPFGKLRMKGSGSDGGHNGLKDIQNTLESNQYARLRFGIGSEFNKGQQVNYVLGDWGVEESELLNERIETSIKFIEAFCCLGLGLAMTQWNGK